MITCLLIRARKGITGMTSMELTLVEAEIVADMPTTLDDMLIESWLQSKPETTKRAYRREAKNLLAHIGKHLQDISIYDMQAYERDELMNKAVTSRARAIAAIRSLYRRLLKAHEISTNPADLWEPPKIAEKIHERYLSPEQ